MEDAGNGHLSVPSEVTGIYYKRNSFSEKFPRIIMKFKNFILPFY